MWKVFKSCITIPAMAADNIVAMAPQNKADIILEEISLALELFVNVFKTPKVIPKRT